MDPEKEISAVEFIDASMLKNRNQLVLLEVDIKFLSIKRRRLMLTQNPLEEQTVGQQIRDKEQAKAAVEESIRILEELRAEYAKSVLA